MANPILTHAQQVGRIAFGDPPLVKRGPDCMPPPVSTKPLWFDKLAEIVRSKLDITTTAQ